MTAAASVWDTLPAPKAQPTIVSGRYRIQGDLYTRATTWAKTLEDTYNLEKWGNRMVALGLAARHDLYAQVAATPATDKKALDRLCDDAREAAKGSAGANLGTALHSFTEQVDLGVDVNIPPPWDADVAAYRRTLADAGVEVVPELVELVVVNRKLGKVAGKFDRLVRHRGRLAVFDLKTGNVDFAWLSIAIQLAIYANADELYDPATDTCSPMPDGLDRTVGLVAHLPAGQASCTLYEVDLAAGWEAAQLCGVVRQWRTRRNLSTPIGSPAVTPAVSAPTDAPVVELRPRWAWIQRRVQTVVAYTDAALELSARWPDGVPTLKAAQDHDDAQIDLIVEACVFVEKAFGLPFPEPDPAAPKPALPLEVSPSPSPAAPHTAPAGTEQTSDPLVERVAALKNAARVDPVVVIAKELGVARVVDADAAQRRVIEAAVGLAEEGFEAEVVAAAWRAAGADPSAFVEIAAALCDGTAALTFGDDGAPVIAVPA